MLQFTTKLAAAAMSSFLILGVGAAMAGSGEAADTTNIHAGPSNGSRIVDQLYAGEPIDIRACRGNWCFVTHPGPDGWVRAGALQQANYDYDDAPPPSYGGGGFVVINPPGGHPHKPSPGIIVDPVHTHPNGPIVGA